MVLPDPSPARAADGMAGFPAARPEHRPASLETYSHQTQSEQKQDSPPLAEYYDTLFRTLGPQQWWPGETQFEIVVGAILTQNTSWRNVESAIANLRRARLLTPQAI